ncbi:hypothetical protein J2T22_001941 [Pseudarthrobacter defluvii]|uniref:Secreted protein n=1 Tax=Pseudarthrobacter defluvii TaxID=410837 RepID=A0ABT9UGI4_9MICC|nr:hypothetical protein [Pseudarthrobacter defluvii]
MKNVITRAAAVVAIAGGAAFSGMAAASAATPSPDVVGVLQTETFRAERNCQDRYQQLLTYNAVIVKPCTHVGGAFGEYYLQFRMT